MYYILFIVAILTSSTAWGQQKKAPCNCPKTNYTSSTPEMSFRFRNGNSIVLCGFQEPDGQESSFSEFVLAVCGQRYIIDFWDAQKICHVRASADTLTVEELVNFPTGRSFAYERSVWTIEKFYFVHGKLARKLSPNRNLKKYDSATIQQILNKYETGHLRSDDERLELARRLLVATFSGSTKARNYLTNFRSKSAIPDGEFSQDYTDLLAKLACWDKK